MSVPKVLPTMVWGVDDEDPIVLHEVLQANLPDDTLRMLRDTGRTVLDVLAGTVPGLDPWEIITTLWEEMLELDDYYQCLERLPGLLADYETPVE